MAAKTKKSAPPAARSKAGNKAVAKRVEKRADKNDDKRVSVPGIRASHDRRLRFAELLLGISQKMSGMDTLDEVLALISGRDAERLGATPQRMLTTPQRKWKPWL